MTKVIVMALSLFLTIVFSSSQEKKETSLSMRKPTFNPELARLSFLAGEFATEGKIHETPMMKGGSTQGKSKGYWSLDSLYLMIDEENEMGAMGMFRGHSILTYDAREKKYRMWHYNNFGDTPYYEGDFTGDTLSMITEINSPEGSFKQKISWYLEGKKIYFQVMNYMEGGYTPVFEETATPEIIKSNIINIGNAIPVFIKEFHREVKVSYEAKKLLMNWLSEETDFNPQNNKVEAIDEYPTHFNLRLTTSIRIEGRTSGVLGYSIYKISKDGKLYGYCFSKWLHESRHL
ncbi:MAG: DUF1579 family protein [Ignavibacteriae bacterium]|nr:DUF1579 family protein [Ignavibacteriota bacterium]